MNRDDYMNGAVDHHTYYLAVADAIGRDYLQRIVLTIAPLEQIRAALESDANLNNIPLPKWDSMNVCVLQAVRERGKAVMAISWSDKARHNLRDGTVCWSLSETVCVLKAVARRMAERQGE